MPKTPRIYSRGVRDQGIRWLKVGGALESGWRKKTESVAVTALVGSVWQLILNLGITVHMRAKHAASGARVVTREVVAFPETESATG